jgi:hypothetical protein
MMPLPKLLEFRTHQLTPDGEDQCLRITMMNGVRVYGMYCDKGWMELSWTAGSVIHSHVQEHMPGDELFRLIQEAALSHESNP